MAKDSFVKTLAVSLARQRSGASAQGSEAIFCRFNGTESDDSSRAAPAARPPVKKKY